MGKSERRMKRRKHAYVRNPDLAVPGLKKRQRLVVAAYKGMASPYRRLGETSPIDRHARRLIREGLLKVVRRKWSDPFIRRSRYVATPKAEEAIWSGVWPAAKPKPKSQRREKRSRHV